MSDAERKLGDHVVDHLRTERERLRKQWDDEGLTPKHYSVAIEVNRLAEALGVSSMAINGALGHLHRDGRVVGFRVERAATEPPTYAIALRD